MFLFQIIMTIFVQIAAFIFFAFTNKSNKNNWKKTSILFLISILVTFFVSYIARFVSQNIVEFTKFLIVYELIYCAAIIDYRMKIIPNILIFLGFLVRSICYVVEIVWLKCDWKEILLQDLLGVIAGAGTLLLMYAITKDSIGLGDVKIFLVIGITCGFHYTYQILFWSILIAAICGTYCLVVKKYKKDHAIAFAPCILAGYLLSMILVIHSYS